VLLKCKIRSTKFEIRNGSTSSPSWAQSKDNLKIRIFQLFKQGLDFGHLEFGFVSSFDIRISDFHLLFGGQKHSLDYARNFWDTTLDPFYCWDEPTWRVALNQSFSPVISFFSGNERRSTPRMRKYERTTRWKKQARIFCLCAIIAFRRHLQGPNDICCFLKKQIRGSSLPLFSFS
jgi:hypothetical protein